jgi:hypothetical protein
MSSPSPSPFRWASLSGQWKGKIFDVYDNPMWRLVLDLTFQENGDFSGPCVFRGLQDPLHRGGQLDGFGVLQEGGTVLLTGAVIDDEDYLFFPTLTLSVQGRRPRLEGTDRMTDVRAGFDKAPLLAAARAAPGTPIDETDVGAQIDWYGGESPWRNF